MLTDNWREKTVTTLIDSPYIVGYKKKRQDDFSLDFHRRGRYLFRAISPPRTKEVGTVKGKNLRVKGYIYFLDLLFLRGNASRQ